MKVSVCTLGCKVNHYETQVLRRLLSGRGAEFVPFGTPCDLSIVHSCAVTEESARKTRQMMRRARRASPEGIVAVIGCLAQVEPGSLAEADIILGNRDKSSLLSLVDTFSAERKPVVHVPDILKYRTFEPMTVSQDERVRATVKIQDGCCNFCAYCIIPFARGPIRSKELTDAVSEVETLVKNGYKEIVLTGIHLDSYGREHGRFSLLDLLERLDEIPGLGRIRLGSTEPVMVTAETVERFKKLKHLCHHFNLSLQSGCTATLKRMRRRYTAEQYAEGVALLCEAFPDRGLSGGDGGGVRRDLCLCGKNRLFQNQRFPLFAPPRDGRVGFPRSRRSCGEEGTVSPSVGFILPHGTAVLRTVRGTNPPRSLRKFPWRKGLRLRPELPFGGGGQQYLSYR